LSISAIKVSELEGHRRFDAEYYQPNYLELIHDLEKAHSRSLSEIAKIQKRKFEPISGRKFNYIEISEVNTETGRVNAIEILGEEAPSRAQHIVQAGDVIISSVRPNRNAVALITKNLSEFVCSSGFVVLRPRNVPAEFLFITLKTSFVRTLLNRQTTATMYPAVSETDLIDTPVIIPSDKIIGLIVGKVQKATQLQNNADNLFTEAEQLLSAELGLDRLDLPTEDVTTRQLSDILNVKRIDAEYFHPQKAFVQEWLGKYSGKTIGEYFKPVREIYNPPAFDTGKSILNFDLTDALHYFVDEDDEMTPENEIGSIRKWLKRGDVIISRLRSYLKEIAYVNVPQSVDSVGSFEFIVLRQLRKDVHPELLIVYLRSKPVQTILKWSQDGSNHPRFNENELLAILLPDKTLKLQDEIRRMVQSGIQANKDAKRLMAEAVSEVERLIEGG
jgi:restriction endonuclease S subunit